MTVTLTRLQLLQVHQGLLALVPVPMPASGALAIKRAFTALSSEIARQVTLQPTVTEDDQREMVAFMAADVVVPVQPIPIGLLGAAPISPLTLTLIEPLLIIPANL